MSLRSPPYLTIPALVATLALSGCRDLPTDVQEGAETQQALPEPVISAAERASLRAALTDASDRLVPSMGDGTKPLSAALTSLSEALDAGTFAAVRAARTQAGLALDAIAASHGEDFDAEIDAIRLILDTLDDVVSASAIK